MKACRRGWFRYYTICSLNRKALSEMDSRGLVIAGFWNTPRRILRSCDYPTDIAADVLRRNAIRIAELPGSQSQCIILER